MRARLRARLRTPMRARLRARLVLKREPKAGLGGVAVGAKGGVEGGGAVGAKGGIEGGVSEANNGFGGEEAGVRVNVGVSI